MSETQQLKVIREKIDAVDLKIKDLLNKRARYALEIARIKQEESEDIPVYRPEREQQIIRTITHNVGPFPAKKMAEIFLEIMSQCRALQQPLRIAYLQELQMEHAVTHHFGSAIEQNKYASASEIISAVQQNKADYGILPLIDLTNFAVKQTNLEKIIAHKLIMTGEINSENMHYIIVGKHAVAPSGRDKTYLLVLFPEYNFSPTVLWENFKTTSVFYYSYLHEFHQKHEGVLVAIAGHQQDMVVRYLVHALTKLELHYKLLGSYPL